MAENSNVSQEWVDGIVARYPPAVIEETGDIRLFGRFAFFNCIGDKPKDKNGKERSHGLVLLIPSKTDLSLLKNAAIALLREKAPAALSNPDVAKKYNNPFKKQDEFIDVKTGALYDGFVAGRPCMSFNSPKSAPLVVRQNMAPIVDRKDCKSGDWGFVSVAPKWFDVEQNKGPTFYLQQVMKVADDTSLGGTGSADPRQAFAGISIDASVNPSDAFGTGGGPAAEEAVDIFG